MGSVEFKDQKNLICFFFFRMMDLVKSGLPVSQREQALNQWQHVYTKL